MADSPGPVLIGYEADDSGTDALILGLELAASLGLSALVVKVHTSPAPIGSGRVDAEWVADRRAAALSVLDTARSRVASWSAPPIVPEYRLEPSSSAARGLSDLAESLDASLIVVGSAATEGYERRVFAGSTASRLLSGAPCPVAVAPKNYADRGDWSSPSRIGVAYLATEEGAVALRAAAEAARRTGASLHIYTAVAEEASVVPWLVGVDGENAFAATARDSYQASLDSAVSGLVSGLDVTSSLLVGNVVHLLADLRDIDLLFCGSRGYGPVRRVLLGGVSSRLVRRAYSPVVVVPRPEV